MLLQLMLALTSLGLIALGVCTYTAARQHYLRRF